MTKDIGNITNKVSEDKLQELIDKYSEDTFADLLDLAHYTIDSVDNIVESLEELLILRKENKTLNKTIDSQHETTISDLKLIGKLQQENKDWAEGAEISNGRIRQLRKFNDALDKENDNLKDIVTKLQIKNKDNEDQ